MQRSANRPNRTLQSSSCRSPSLKLILNTIFLFDLVLFLACLLKNICIYVLLSCSLSFLSLIHEKVKNKSDCTAHQLIIFTLWDAPLTVFYMKIMLLQTDNPLQHKKHCQCLFPATIFTPIISALYIYFTSYFY